MTKARRADASRNREEIVRAAKAEFSEHGFDVPLERIASRSGVSRMTLSRHFRDREDLAYAIFEDDVAKLKERAVEWITHEDAYFLFLSNLMNGCAQSVGLTEVLAQNSSGRDKLAELRQRVVGIAIPLLHKSKQHGLVRADLAEDDLYIVIDMFFGVLGKLQPYQRIERSERALALIAEGLRPKSRS